MIFKGSRTYISLLEDTKNEYRERIFKESAGFLEVVPKVMVLQSVPKVIDISVLLLYIERTKSNERHF